MKKTELEELLKEYGFHETICVFPEEYIGKGNGYFVMDGALVGYIEPKELSKTDKKVFDTDCVLRRTHFKKHTVDVPKNRSGHIMYRCDTKEAVIEYLESGDLRKATKEEIEQIYLLRNEYRKKQNSKGKDIKLKEMGQKYYESHYGTRQDFICEFGKSYL